MWLPEMFCYFVKCYYESWKGEMKGENVIEFRRLLASLDEDFRTMGGKKKQNAEKNKTHIKVRHLLLSDRRETWSSRSLGKQRNEIKQPWNQPGSSQMWKPLTESARDWSCILSGSCWAYGVCWNMGWMVGVQTRCVVLVIDLLV